VSGFAGILRFDGGEVDPSALDAMAAALAHRAEGPPRRWAEGAAGLVHLAAPTTPMAAREVQPLADASGQVVLVLDGRVDNRRDVRAALGPARGDLRDDTDAELVLAAHLRWGEAAVAHLVGDLAYAIWDGRTQELVCGRDATGRRPLVYLRARRAGHDALRVASEVPGLLADRSIARRPDLGFLAEHLAGSIRSTTATLWDGVHRLPPAHALVARRDGAVRVERAWSWDRSAAVPRSHTARDDARLAGELRDLLDEVVGDHLVAPDPVAAELSGGIDSTAVVALATDRLAAEGRAPLDVHAIVRPGDPGDDTPYLRAAAEHLGIAVAEHDPPPRTMAELEAEVRRSLDLPGAPNLAMAYPHLAIARAAGARVVLTGLGGDERFTGSRLAYADDLRRLRLRGLRRAAADDRRTWGTSSAGHQLLRDGVLPLLPAGIGARVERATGRAASYHQWIPEPFRRAVELDDRLHQPPIRGRVLAAEERARFLDDGTGIRERELLDAGWTAQGVEARAPLDDRRVVEHALRLPDDVLRRGGTTKWILREAVGDRLAPPVRTRTGKASFGRLIFEGIEALGGAERLGRLAAYDHGWLDRSAILALHRECQTAYRERRGHPGLWILWSALGTDVWFGLTCTEVPPITD
jgi:asparagine synthase (glutamine-hydrolysing)